MRRLNAWALSDDELVRLAAYIVTTYHRCGEELELEAPTQLLLRDLIERSEFVAESSRTSDPSASDIETDILGYMTVSQIADRVTLSRRQVQRAISDGALYSASHFTGRGWRVETDAAERWIAKQNEHVNG